MALSEPMSELIRKVDDIFHSTIAATETLAQEIGDLLSRSQALSRGLLLEPAVKRELQALIKQTINRSPYCAGAGFASHIENAPNSEEFWLLEWWYKVTDGVEQVNLDLDQATQQRLDFRTFEWFKSTPTGGKAYFHGPYVDYICNTSYTLTSAIPIYFDHQFMGVAAVDLLVSLVEQELLAHYQNNRVILTNQYGRVIFSTWPKYRVGDLVKTAELTLVYQTDYVALYQV